MDYTEANEPHDKQVEDWVEHVTQALIPWLTELESYDDKVILHRVLFHELRRIAEAAHAAGMNRAARQAA